MSWKPVTALSEFPEGSFEGFRALNVQTYTESNVKLGMQYEASVYNPALASGDTAYFVFKTGDKPIALKGRRIEFDGLGVVSTVFKDPVYTGGVAIPVFNLNHKNPVAGTIDLFGGVTVTDEGLQIQSSKTYLGAALNGNQIQVESGQEAQGIEYIYDANSEYLFKVESIDQSDNQRVSSYVTWYEGDLDLPLP